MVAKGFKTLFVAAGLALSTTLVDAAFLVQIDIDGADDGILTLSPNFGYGGDTTSASQSSPATAAGLPVGDSVFGGNGSASPDTYTFSYTPGSDADNLSLTAGDSLNGSGATATGIVGGSTGLYDVYATWPMSTNVSGGLTSFEMDFDGGQLSTQLDQVGTGNEWFSLGQIQVTMGTTYTLSQIAGSNTFVSMRGAAVLFEQSGATPVVPEPSASLLVILASAGLLLRRRR